MRLRTDSTSLALPGFAVLVAGCVSASSSLQPDASITDDGSVATEASTTADATPTVDAPPASDDAGTDAPASDDASVDDATVVDASDANAAEASDAGTGGALVFDGVDNLVGLPASDGGANETAYSVELWFNTTTASGSMFEVYGGGGADRFLCMNAGSVCFYVYGSPTTRLCSSAATYADGAWHHAAGTLGSVGGMNLYVDGTLSNSAATPTSSGFNYDTAFRLGYGHTDLNSALIYFGGKLSEVRLWSIERSAADIHASYKTRLPGTTPGLQGYWPLDATGTTAMARDATPNGNDGTLMGFTFVPSPWVSPGPF